jgi:hypothetical protein
VGDVEDQMVKQLEALVAGDATPDDVAAWATHTMENEDNADALDDPATWEILDKMAGADLLSGPGQYLHGQADFAEWLTDFRSRQ